MESLAQPRSAGEQLGEKEEREGQQEGHRGRESPYGSVAAILGVFLLPLELQAGDHPTLVRWVCPRHDVGEEGGHWGTSALLAV